MMKHIFSLSKQRPTGAHKTVGFEWSSVRNQQERIGETEFVLFRLNRMHVVDDFRTRMSNASSKRIIAFFFTVIRLILLEYQYVVLISKCFFFDFFGCDCIFIIFVIRFIKIVHRVYT